MMAGQKKSTVYSFSVVNPRLKKKLEQVLDDGMFTATMNIILKRYYKLDPHC